MGIKKGKKRLKAKLLKAKTKQAKAQSDRGKDKESDPRLIDARKKREETIEAVKIRLEEKFARKLTNVLPKFNNKIFHDQILNVTTWSKNESCEDKMAKVLNLITSL